MKINLVQPMMSHQPAEPALAKVLQPVQNTAYLLAALVPPGHEVRVTDEYVERADPDRDDADLVGITFVTGFAPRAYALADRYRALGKTVVFGGPHTTLMPGEALEHADAVVLGEADETWPQLIRDREAGRMGRIYRAASPPDPAIIPRSRHDLVRGDVFFMPRALQASRGCPFVCDYCTLPGFYGAGFRPRPVRDVVAEIESLDWKPGMPPLLFWDDNLVGNPRWAKQLFRELIPLRLTWLSQCTITIADDEELAALAGRSGAVGVFCGLESFSEASLRGVRKAFNRVRDYKEKLKRLHHHGITVTAGVVFGFDEDTPDVFDLSIEAAEEIALDAAAVGVLVPYPGTPVYDRLQREGRILTRDWSLYDGEHVVIRPRRMTPEQLDEGMRRMRRRFYSWPSIFRRLGRAQASPHVSLMANLAYLAVARNGLVSPGIPPADDALAAEAGHAAVVAARRSLPVFSGWSGE